MSFCAHLSVVTGNGRNFDAWKLRASKTTRYETIHASSMLLKATIETSRMTFSQRHPPIMQFSDMLCWIQSSIRCFSSSSNGELGRISTLLIWAPLLRSPLFSHKSTDRAEEYASTRWYGLGVTLLGKLITYSSRSPKVNSPYCC